MTALLDSYAAWLRAANCSDRTVTERLAVVRRFGTLAGGDPAAMTAMHAVTFIGSVESAWSRVTYYSHVASWARFLSAMGLGGEWIATVPKPRAGRGTPKPVTDQQLFAALAVAEPRTRTMILLGAYQGLRVSEIARVHDRDVTERTLRVRGKGGRTRSLPTHPLVWAERDRMARDAYWFSRATSEGKRLSVAERRAMVGKVAAGADMLAVAREYGIARQNVWTWYYRWTIGGDAALGTDPADRPLSREHVYVRITDAFKAAGFTATPHQLRHWHATSLLRSGANIRVVQELMRHVSLATTQCYTKVDDDECAAAILGLPTLRAAAEVAS